MSESAKTPHSEFASRVEHIAGNKASPEKIINDLSWQELSEFLDYIEEQIVQQMQKVNAIYLSNPAWKYGRDFTIEDLEKLKKVKELIESLL